MKRFKFLCCALVFLFLGSTGVLASNFEINGGIAKGDLLISDHWYYEQLKDPMVLFQVQGRLPVTEDLTVEVSHTFGKDKLKEPDEAGLNLYGYSNTKLEGVFGFTDTFALLVGYTRFASRYNAAWSESMVPLEVENRGGGFKLGFVTTTQARSGLSLSIRYAYLPLVASVTTISDEEVNDYEYDTYLGAGHELKAALSYNFASGLSLYVGYIVETYSGISACCSDTMHQPAGFRGLQAGLSWAF